MLKRMMLVGLLTIALSMPWRPGESSAAALPSYLSNSWVGIICVNGPTPVSPQKIKLLIQMTFDKSSNGGISLAQADQVFAFLRTSFLNFSGATEICPALKPSVVQAQYAVNGLQAAQQLTGTYQNYGLELMVILDSFWVPTQNYLNQPSGAQSLRSDTFLVTGNNSVFYQSSSENLKSLVVP